MHNLSAAYALLSRSADAKVPSSGCQSIQRTLGVTALGTLTMRSIKRWRLWIPVVLCAVLSPELALTQIPSADTNVKETVPETGTRINRTIASSQRFPLNKKWSELSEEDRAVFRSQYEDMPNTDEPPYPIDGMAPIFRQLSVEAGRAGVFIMDVTVNPQGKGIL